MSSIERMSATDKDRLRYRLTELYLGGSLTLDQHDAMQEVLRPDYTFIAQQLAAAKQRSTLRLIGDFGLLYVLPVFIGLAIGAFAWAGGT